MIGSIAQGKICPWMGKLCPGEDQCAPAAVAAHEKQNPDGSPVAPYCPLVVAIDCLCAIGLAQEVRATSKQAAEAVVSEAKLTPEEENRRRVLQSITADQEA